MWLPRFFPSTLLVLGLACRREALVSAGAGLLELSLDKFKNVLLNQTIPVEAVIRNIASNVTVIIFQVHSHQKNVTISFDKNSSANSSETGVDKGLVSILRPQQSVCTWYLQSPDAKQVLSTAVSFAYSERDPIPGGCNLEFNLEVDPNIYLEYNLIDTCIKFAPANLGYARGANPPSCDSGTGQNSRWRLHYDIYQYFLPENDLSETALLNHLRKMSDVQSVRANGVRLVSLTTDEKTNVHFSSLPGQGVIYNVIVWDPLWNTSAAYVPVHTYACSLTALVDNCSSLRDYKVFRDDAVFWVTFSCIALMVPIVFVGCPRILNILACGIVGSYSVVLAIACYLYTSLAYITLDLLRRVLNDDFSQAYTNVPFQTNDLIILAVWGMLAVGGIMVQLRRERREVPFPPHPYRIWKRERERRITNILDPSHHIPPLRERIHNKLSQIKEFFRKEQPAGERTPLLL
ncbi:transmembrane 7 superfamily member 3 isoform X3 [Caretta caretta]|uniref:transmembrane 7 superfamily member 3 isoform X3 n=1 Tax=Caretta caretta TaxID=8467 RepID=UPI0020943916|nr:transmembrane 7 superfamily member 3 isoform X4 [Caretta caretta]